MLLLNVPSKYILKIRIKNNDWIGVHHIIHVLLKAMRIL